MGATGVSLAQATTNTLGIPAGAPNPGAQSNPTTAQGAAAPTSPNARHKYPLPDTFSNQSHPAPTPTPLPNHLSVSGKVRGYSYDRLFNRQIGTSNVNKHATEFSLAPHFDYRLGNSNFNIGWTPAFATGFGLNGPNPENVPPHTVKISHVDNTLPGYPLSQPGAEAYLQYKDKNNMFTVGDMYLNYPWIALSDSRIVPSSFRGADSQVALGSTLSAGLTRVTDFEARNSSLFEPNTLLTAAYPGASLYKYHPFNPGTMRVDGNYHPSSNLVLSAEDDQFYNLANMVYLEGKYGFAPYNRANPYLAAQYVSEQGDGLHYLGHVKNTTYGAQLGVTPIKNVLFTVSADLAPWKYAYVSATSASKAAGEYFVGSGGTGDALKIGPDEYQVAYGGIASPYTDSYGTDPLYTTMITQGMVDRRSAGESYKTAIVFTNQTKQFRIYAAEAWFNYSNVTLHNLTSEFNADGTYYFNKVRAGAYKGFFVRVRLAPRQQVATPTTPQRFEYQRFMTEYDF